jgi:hypothetical protein
MNTTGNATDRGESTRLAFSVKGLAQAYSVSPSLIRLEIARHRLRVSRIGRRLVIPVEAVNEWLRLSDDRRL